MGKNKKNKAPNGSKPPIPAASPPPAALHRLPSEPTPLSAAQVSAAATAAVQEAVAFTAPAQAHVLGFTEEHAPYLAAVLPLRTSDIQRLMLVPSQAAETKDDSAAPAPALPRFLHSSVLWRPTGSDISELEHEDICALLDILPDDVAAAFQQLENTESRVFAILLDVGRRVHVLVEDAHSPDRTKCQPLSICLPPDYVPTYHETTQHDVDTLCERLGGLVGDRCGVSGTLHHVSALRSRSGAIHGLTVRVTRPLFGCLHIIQDLICSAHSLLFLGPPGVGKTAFLREAARMLSDLRHQRVVVVDTWDELGGAGPTIHPSLGSARRLEVATRAEQASLILQAVQHHLAQVVIVDEIGTPEEVRAVYTLRAKGVRILAAAAAPDLWTVLGDLDLKSFAGSVRPVSEGSPVLERAHKPLFDCAVELQSPYSLLIHRDLSAAVDGLLAGSALTPLSVLERRADAGPVKAERRELQRLQTAAAVGADGTEAPTEREATDVGCVTVFAEWL